jgi:hypothetical protein
VGIISWLIKACFFGERAWMEVLCPNCGTPTVHYRGKRLRARAERAEQEGERMRAVLQFIVDNAPKNSLSYEVACMALYIVP